MSGVHTGSQSVSAEMMAVSEYLEELGEHELNSAKNRFQLESREDSGGGELKQFD